MRTTRKMIENRLCYLAKKIKIPLVLDSYNPDGQWTRYHVAISLDSGGYSFITPYRLRAKEVMIFLDGMLQTWELMRHET